MPELSSGMLDSDVAARHQLHRPLVAAIIHIVKSFRNPRLSAEVDQLHLLWLLDGSSVLQSSCQHFLLLDGGGLQADACPIRMSHL